MSEPLEHTGPVCAAEKCTRPAAAGSHLCAVDGRKLGDWLAGLQTEYELLSAAPSMQGREVGSIGGNRLASQRSPGNTHVMALRDPRRVTNPCTDPDPWGFDDTPSVYETLATYAELVREGRQLTPPTVDVTHVRRARPAGPVCDPHAPPCGHHTCEVWTFRATVFAPLTVASERKLLATHLDWIVGQDFAGEFFDEIRRLWALLRAANGHPTPTARVRRLHVPCPECQVRAVTYRPGDGKACCENCGTCRALDETEDAA